MACGWKLLLNMTENVLYAMTEITFVKPILGK